VVGQNSVADPLAKLTTFGKVNVPSPSVTRGSRPPTTETVMKVELSTTDLSMLRDALENSIGAVQEELEILRVQEDHEEWENQNAFLEELKILDEKLKHAINS